MLLLAACQLHVPFILNLGQDVGLLGDGAPIEPPSPKFAGLVVMSKRDVREEVELGEILLAIKDTEILAVHARKRVFALMAVLDGAFVLENGLFVGEILATFPTLMAVGTTPDGESQVEIPHPATQVRRNRVQNDIKPVSELRLDV